MKNYYRERMNLYLGILGGECRWCGSIEHLEIDHIDPSTKSFNISKKWTYLEMCLEELNKCQCLCKKCHRIKSKNEKHQKMLVERENKHGTLSQYMRYGCRCSLCKENYRRWHRLHR